MSPRHSSPEPAPAHIVPHPGQVTREQREALHGHRGAVLWLTGLSASGKSTLAYALEDALHDMDCHAVVLDGDALRSGLCRDLGFGEAARDENLRRAAEVAKILLGTGAVVIAAFITPLQRERDAARAIIGGDDFLEVHCKADLATCERRDPKGFYLMAREGTIEQFTGVSAPYEEPEHADLVVDTGQQGVEHGVRALIAALWDRGVVPTW